MNKTTKTTTRCNYILVEPKGFNKRMVTLIYGERETISRSAKYLWKTDYSNLADCNIHYGPFDVTYHDTNTRVIIDTIKKIGADHE